MIKGIIPKINYEKTFSLPVMLDNNYPIAFADNIVLRFLNDLSKNILKEPSFKLEPSFVALGFWLRKKNIERILFDNCLLYTSPSPRDRQKSRMPSSA